MDVNEEGRRRRRSSGGLKETRGKELLTAKFQTFEDGALGEDRGQDTTDGITHVNSCGINQ